MNQYNKIERTPDYDKIHFAVIGIEHTAKRMNITTNELTNRLNNVGLIDNFIIECYDTLHSESADAVASNIEEALLIREQKGVEND